MPQRTAVVAAIAAALSWAAFSAGPADANGGDHDHGGNHGGTQVAVPTPTVAGPVSTPLAPNRIQGFPYTASAVNLRSHSYTEKEYFVSGTARAYTPVGTLGTDGRWTVTQASTAPYKTRILVRRPRNMRRFSGNVVVEWMNATTGRDLDVGWTFGYSGMLHDGDIYVGVTAQGLPITSPTGLKAWDPQRYGSLSIPDDAYSYDIFSQVGKALRSPQNSAVLGGARLKQLIGYGDSQSAFRLVTYVDAIQPRDQIYDSFLIHSRFGTPAALNTGATPPNGTIVRTDTNTAKIITLETESDIARNNGFLSARQPDSSSFRLWELTGGSHISDDEELLQRIQAFKEWPLNSPPLNFNVCTQKTDTLDEGAVVDTALHDLSVWTSHGGHGAAPPRFPLLDVSGTGASATYVLDSSGDTVGGLRMPQITVPIEALHGLGNTGTANCSLQGVATEYSTAQLHSLYPTHAAYVAKFTAAVRRAQRAGVLQPYDADDEIDQAQDSAVPETSYVP